VGGCRATNNPTRPSFYSGGGNFIFSKYLFYTPAVVTRRVQTTLSFSIKSEKTKIKTKTWNCVSHDTHRQFSLVEHVTTHPSTPSHPYRQNWKEKPHCRAERDRETLHKLQDYIDCTQVEGERVVCVHPSMDAASPSPMDRYYLPPPHLSILCIFIFSTGRKRRRGLRHQTLGAVTERVRGGGTGGGDFTNSHTHLMMMDILST
jgi:hypothetical protein